jgi:5-formyltetrahydrofolate cyclo-ligase
MEENVKSMKQVFREKCIKELKKRGGYGAYIKDKKIVARLYELIIQENAEHIMLYLPLKNEVNLYPLIKRLRKEKKVLYVPVMEGKSFRLEKYRYPLRVRRFGITEPNDSKQFRRKKIDIAVVPIVGVDAALRRVGFGKGMYDRFFEKEIKNIKKVVFVARKLCYSGRVITDSYDVKADMVIVP